VQKGQFIITPIWYYSKRDKMSVFGVEAHGRALWQTRLLKYFINH